MPHAHASVWARARNPGPVRGPAFSETQMAPRCPRRPSKQGPCGPAPASRKRQARQSPPAFRQLSPVPTAHVRKLRWMNHTRCYLLAQDPAPNAQTPRVRGGGCGSGRCFLPRPNALGGACRPEGPVSPGSSGLLQARCWAGGGRGVGSAGPSPSVLGVCPSGRPRPSIRNGGKVSRVACMHLGGLAPHHPPLGIELRGKPLAPAVGGRSEHRVAPTSAATCSLRAGGPVAF